MRRLEPGAIEAQARKRDVAGRAAHQQAAGDDARCRAGAGDRQVARDLDRFGKCAGGELRNLTVWNSALSVESSSLLDDTFSSAGIEATLSDVAVISSTVDRISVDGSSPAGASLTLGCSIFGYCTPNGADITYTNYGLNVLYDGQPCVGPSDVDGDWYLYRLWVPPGKFPARVPNPYSALSSSVIPSSASPKMSGASCSGGSTTTASRCSRSAPSRPPR